MLRTQILKLVLPVCVCVGCYSAMADTSPVTPRPAPMDLKTGKTSSTMVSENEPNSPLSPPQTVEGVLVSKDADSAVIRTKRDGDVKVGLPSNIPVSRDGRTSIGTLDDVKPGDRVYATVVTANGNRAIRLVSEAPYNPLVNYVGIPVLGVIALGIWRIRCLPPKGGVQAKESRKAKS